MFTNIINLEEVDSTNEYAKNILESSTGFTVITSKIQLKGKGRMGNTWDSRLGGLYASIILKGCSKSDFYITMMISSAIHKMLHNIGINASIKYPNDIVVNGNKICGILIERRNKDIVIGFGINVFNNINNGTSILKETNNSFEIQNILLKTLDLFGDIWFDSLSEIYTYYLDHQFVLGKEITYNNTSYKVVNITMKGEVVLEDSKQNKLVLNNISLKELYNEV